MKKYISDLKKENNLEPAIYNCPDINFNEINEKANNLVKKEKKVEAQNAKINNRINHSVKNNRIKIGGNKNEIKKNKNKKNLQIDKIPKNIKFCEFIEYF